MSSCWADIGSAKTATTFLGWYPLKFSAEERDCPLALAGPSTPSRLLQESLGACAALLPFLALPRTPPIQVAVSYFALWVHLPALRQACPGQKPRPSWREPASTISAPACLPF